MTVKQAAMTSMEEYQMRLDGFNKQQQEEWERLRWQEWHQTILNPYIKREHRPKTPKDLIRFPWDEDDKPKITREQCYITREQEEELNRIFSTINNKKNG